MYQYPHIQLLILGCMILKKKALQPLTTPEGTTTPHNTRRHYNPSKHQKALQPLTTPILNHTQERNATTDSHLQLTNY
jgi:hypothetical protein